MCTISIISFSHVATSNTTTDIIVNGTATNTGGSGCNVVDVTVTCGTNTVTGSVSVVAGAWTITLNTSCVCNDTITITATCTSGGLCSDTLTAPITCSCCPSIGIKQTILPCTPGGLRPIQFDVTIDVPLQCAPCSVQLDFGDTTFGVVQNFATSGSFTYSETHTYNPAGFPYTGLLNVITPTGCPPTSFLVSAPPCPPNCCPTITNMNYNVGDCDNNGDRPVNLMATVTPNGTTGCPPTTQVYWDFGDSSSGPLHTVNATTTISDTHTYDPSGSPYNATLVIVNPTGCASPTMAVNVPDCAPCEKFWLGLLCSVARFAFVFFGVLALTFITVGVGVLLMSFPPIAAGPMLLLGVGFLLIWLLAYWFIDKYCLPCNPCGWVVHPYGQIFFITAFTIGLFWGPMPGLGFVSILYGFFLGLPLLIGYATNCGLDDCGVWREFFNVGLMAIVFIFLIYFMLITLFPPLVGVISWVLPVVLVGIIVLLSFIGLIVNNC